MAEFFNAISAVLMIFMLMAVGYVLGRMKWISGPEKKFISRFVVNLAVPLNCIVGLQKNLNHDDLVQAAWLILSAMLGVAITLIFSGIVGKLLKLPRSRWGVFTAMAGTSNTLFIGLPMTTQLLGEVSVPYVMLYYLSSTIFTQSVVVMLIQRAGSTRTETKGFAGIVKDLVTKPPIIGVFVGVLLLVLDIQPPALFMKFAGYLSNTVTPLALLYCGYIVYEVGLRRLRFLPGIPTMLVVRLVISPLIVTGMCALMGITGLVRSVFIVESALPVVSQITVMAGAFGADEEYAAIGSCLSTIGCFVTIPVLMMLI